MLRNRRSRSFFALPVYAALALAFASHLPAAEPALARLVGADAAMVLALHDMPAVRERFPESALGRAWADPEIARFLAPLAKHPDLSEFLETVRAETGRSPVELLELATGDVLLTVPVSSLKLGGENPRIDALLLIEVGDNEAKIAEIIEAARKPENASAADTTEDYNGVTLHLVTLDSATAGKAAGATDDDMDAEPAEAPEAGTEAPAEDARPVVWALHEGRWFIGSERELVTAALDALAAGGRTEPLSASADYLQVAERAGGRADVIFWINWKAAYPAVVSALEAARDPNEEANPFGLEPLNLLRASGLDAIEGISISAGTENDINRMDAALTYTETRGILNLIAYRDGPVAKPEWMPAAWFNVSSQNYSASSAYTELEGLLDRISPVLSGMAMGQVKGFERKLGIELKRDLLGTLGEAFVSGYANPPTAEGAASYEELDQFIGISLADAASFERAVETIKTKFLPADEASPLKKRDYLGRVLYSFEPPQGGRGFTYSIADGWLLVGLGSPATVESAIQLMNTPNPDTSFWERKDVRTALDSVPAGAFSVQHTELAPVLASLAASVVKSQEFLDEEQRLVDPDATPTREQLARYFKHSISHGTRTSAGLFFHTEGPAR